MTEFEDIARQKLTVDPYRMPVLRPSPWYERWFFLVAIALAALAGAYGYALVLLSLE